MSLHCLIPKVTWANLMQTLQMISWLLHSPQNIMGKLNPNPADDVITIAQYPTCLGQTGLWHRGWLIVQNSYKLLHYSFVLNLLTSSADFSSQHPGSQKL